MKLYPNASAIRISADGCTSEIKPSNGNEFNLEEAQKIVGGLIEVIRLTKHTIMVVNEEGKLMGLDYNEKATIIAKYSGAIGISDYIVGNVLICPSEMLP